MKRATVVIFVLLFCSYTYSQKPLEFDGQLSLMGSYAPQNERNLFGGFRYLPELSYGFFSDSNKVNKLDFEASLNLSGSMAMHAFDSTADVGGVLSPYRLWARYSGSQFEVRLGLQKMDFGSSILLRPIQWFNQIDPRDPLQLTNGVYGLLGRYYFVNNTNIWGWILYGNEKRRGFDVLSTNPKVPEIGFRTQFPTPKGEIALSFHQRTASLENIPLLPSMFSIPESRIGLDGKWDFNVGFWFEAVYLRKFRNVGVLTNQSLLNFGSDYTFGIGNGLNVVAEHMMLSYNGKEFNAKDINHLTATTFSYQIGFFDQITSVFLYNWTAKNATVSINYVHQFKNISAYVMGWYNPSTTVAFQPNDLVDQFAGPGIRLMLVYNH